MQLLKARNRARRRNDSIACEFSDVYIVLLQADALDADSAPGEDV